MIKTQLTWRGRKFPHPGKFLAKSCDLGSANLLLLYLKIGCHRIDFSNYYLRSYKYGQTMIDIFSKGR